MQKAQCSQSRRLPISTTYFESILCVKSVKQRINRETKILGKIFKQAASRHPPPLLSLQASGIPRKNSPIYLEKSIHALESLQPQSGLFSACSASRLPHPRPHELRRRNHALRFTCNHGTPSPICNVCTHPLFGLPLLSPLFQNAIVFSLFFSFFIFTPFFFTRSRNSPLRACDLLARCLPAPNAASYKMLRINLK